MFVSASIIPPLCGRFHGIFAEMEENVGKKAQNIEKY